MHVTFSNYIDIKLHLQELEEKYTSLKDKAYSLKGVDHLRERVDGGEHKDYTDTLATLQEIESEYKKAAEEEQKARQTALKHIAIQNLTQDYKKALEMLFIDLLEVNEVAKRLEKRPIQILMLLKDYRVNDF